MTKQPLDGLGMVLVSTADWDNPFWTNKQHVAVQMAKRGIKVLYIESQGLRTPTVTGKDLRRIWNRLRSGLRPPREVRPNLWVWSPLVIPLQGNAMVRRLNRGILQSGHSFWQRMKGIPSDILWTYSPMTSTLYRLDKFKLLVYHSVDDITAQPGMPKEAIHTAERDLVRRCDLVFTTSTSLTDQHKSDNPNTHYFSNVADYDHFAQAQEPSTTVPEDIQQLPAPRIGFIGAISSYKVDFHLLETLATNHPEWSLVLIGEVGEGDPHTTVDRLQVLPNIHFLGARSYHDLPAYLKGMDVAILPNRLNEYTKAMFPMKFFEYLAAGKPVVSTRLDALAAHQDVAHLAKSEDEFEEAILRCLADPLEGWEHRLEAAKEQTYDRRTDKMLEIVAEAMRNKTANHGHQGDT